MVLDFRVKLRVGVRLGLGLGLGLELGSDIVRSSVRVDVDLPDFHTDQIRSDTVRLRSGAFGLPAFNFYQNISGIFLNLLIYLHI